MASSQTDPSNEWAGWFRCKEFSQDWTSPHFPVWSRVLQDWRAKPVEALEIGSWEGRSAVFFLEFMPKCRLVCVDTFAGSPEHLENPDWRANLPLIEKRFDANTAAYKGRVEKIRLNSVAALDGLSKAKRGFDLIYVDGSHRRDDVLVDTLLSWPMLKPGGRLIWDDYGGGKRLPDAERVQPAVDLFMDIHGGECRELHRGYQIIVEKTAAPTTGPSALRRRIRKLGRRLSRY
ncbi:MAG: class I SAM-dependent methyltransferase [Rhodospirillales bacterium]